MGKLIVYAPGDYDAKVLYEKDFIYENYDSALDLLNDFYPHFVEIGKNHYKGVYNSNIICIRVYDIDNECSYANGYYRVSFGRDNEWIDLELRVILQEINYRRLGGSWDRDIDYCRCWNREYVEELSK